MGASSSTSKEFLFQNSDLLDSFAINSKVVPCPDESETLSEISDKLGSMIIKEWSPLFSYPYGSTPGKSQIVKKSQGFHLLSPDFQMDNIQTILDELFLGIVPESLATSWKEILCKNIMQRHFQTDEFLIGSVVLEQEFKDKKHHLDIALNGGGQTLSVNGKKGLVTAFKYEYVYWIV